MRIKNIFVAVLSFVSLSLTTAQSTSTLLQSYFKLTTSNGMIVAAYNAKENRIDDVYPHIFANYEPGKYVHPFVGNMVLNSTERPSITGYLKNTHVITAGYKGFTVNYFSSFTLSDKIFYIVIRGDKHTIENLSFTAETGEGKAVSGITLLENHLQDLPIRIKGNILTGTVMRKYDKNIYEKYFLYSYTDSLQTDAFVVSKAIVRLSKA